MGPDELKRELQDINERVQDWQDRVNAGFKRGWKFEDGFDDAFRDATEAAHTDAGPSPLPDLYGFLDRLTDSYLESDQSTRSDFRDMVGSNRRTVQDVLVPRACR